MKNRPDGWAPTSDFLEFDIDMIYSRLPMLKMVSSEERHFQNTANFSTTNGMS